MPVMARAILRATIPVTEPLSMPSVLLANEPRAYRQALAAAMSARRDGVHVIVVTAEELDAAVLRHHPVLVICDAVTPVVETHAPVWVLLYPEGARLVVTSVFGALTYAADLTLEGLAALVDRALGQSAPGLRER